MSLHSISSVRNYVTHYTIHTNHTGTCASMLCHTDVLRPQSGAALCLAGKVVSYDARSLLASGLHKAVLLHAHMSRTLRCQRYQHKDTNTSRSSVILPQATSHPACILLTLLPCQFQMCTTHAANMLRGQTETGNKTFAFYVHASKARNTLQLPHYPYGHLRQYPNTSAPLAGGVLNVAPF